MNVKNKKKPGNIKDLIFGFLLGASILGLFINFNFDRVQQISEEYLEVLSNPFSEVEDERGFRAEERKLENISFGASSSTAPFRPSSFKTTLSSSLNTTMATSSATVSVSSMVTKDSHTLVTDDIGNFITLTVCPGCGNEEKISCTAISSNDFINCTRGYRYYTDSAVSENVKAHGPGETVIISNDDHYLVTQFPSLDGRNTFLDTNVFSSTTDNIVRLYFGDNSGANIFYNTTTDVFGFSTSTGTDFSFFLSGSTQFTVNDTLDLTSAKLSVNTSTPPILFLESFIIDGGGFFALNTTTDEKVDLFWNIRYNNTTTKDLLTMRNATVTNFFIVGTSVFDTAPTSTTKFTLIGDSYIDGNSTTTGTLNFNTLCATDANCVTSLDFTMASSTGNIYSITGIHSVTSFATTTILGNTMGANGSLLMKVWFDSEDTSAGVDTLSVFFGGSRICGTLNLTADADGYMECQIFNLGATNSQRGLGKIENHGGDISFDGGQTTAIDTTVDVELVLSFTSDNASDTISADGYSVESYYRP